MKMKLLQSMVLLLMTHVASANGLKLDRSDFTEGFAHQVKLISEACSGQQCVAPYTRQIVYRIGEPSKIDPALKLRLEQAATEQSQIWADTILEGDYEAKAPTRLDEVIIFRKAQQIVGYLVTYSERAWDISDCRYDGINDDTLLDCLEGRIVESSYISAAMTEYIHDEKNYAKFYPDIL